MRSIALTLKALICLAVFSGPARAFSDAELIDGFNKTVFGSEYSNISSRAYVRKFRGPARFFVRSEVQGPVTETVKSFIRSLPGLISGLRVELVTSQRKANFVVYVVPKSQYAATVREQIFGNAKAAVSGQCMVRSIYSRGSIRFSDAVIVGDQGADLFNRCMIEEILQGLGPLNDSRSLSHSMFNDESRFSTLQPFDQLILNVLYDPKIRPGTSKSRVQSLLPGAVKRARSRLGY